MSPNEPVDPVHAECMELRRWIRDGFADLKARAATWEPRPIPEDYR